MQTSHNKKRLPLLLRSVPATRRHRRRCSLVAGLLSGVVLFSGCAKDPPSSTSSSALSGKRLRVSITFADTVDPNYYYYFLINYDKTLGGTVGNQSAPGPIAVFGPPYGNGFSAGSDGSTTSGLTDFVEFHGVYTLNHVFIPAGATFQRIIPESSMPVSVTLPNSSSHVLAFDIDLAQLVVDTNGVQLPNAVSLAPLIHWLQVNVVATDIVPTDPATFITKQVDSLGETTTQGGRTSYLTLDLTQNQTFSNTGNNLGVHEPQGDVAIFGPNIDDSNGDPHLDIIDWSITVVPAPQ